MSKIGTTIGNANIDPFLGASTPEINDSMLRDDNHTPNLIPNDGVDGVLEGKKEYGGTKSASTSPVIFGLGQNSKRYSKAAIVAGPGESHHQREVQTKRIDESSIDKEETSVGPHGVQVKSLMSRVGGKGARGDREASDAKY